MDALAAVIFIILLVSLGAFLGIIFERKQRRKAIEGIKNEVWSIEPVELLVLHCLEALMYCLARFKVLSPLATSFQTCF